MATTQKYQVKTMLCLNPTGYVQYGRGLKETQFLRLFLIACTFKQWIAQVFNTFAIDRHITRTGGRSIFIK